MRGEDKTLHFIPMESTGEKIAFQGFQSPHYTLVPKVVADHLMQDLTTGELRCLLYILGHTFGWKKHTDQISLSQFMGGIKTKEGEIKDCGAGLSKNILLQSLKSLEKNGIIFRNRRMTRMGDCDSTEFSLKFFVEKNKKEGATWPWKRSAFFQVPDQLLNDFLPTLSGSELKVLLFIARWTSQTENQVSQISIKEMTQGIVKAGGEVLSKGSGIADRKNLAKIVRQLEEKKMLYRKMKVHESGGKMASEYSLFQEGEGVEITPTLHGVETLPTQGVISLPTHGVKKVPTLGVKNTPTQGVKTEPDTIIALTKEYLNTTSKELTQKFYQTLKIKASSKKIEKEKGVVKELLERDGFTPEQIQNSFPWIAKKFPDTFHIHRLPMLIGEALRGVCATHRVLKTKEDESEQRIRELEKSKKLIQEFENLPEEIQKSWIAKAPKLLTLEPVRKAWAVGQFQLKEKHLNL